MIRTSIEAFQIDPPPPIDDNLRRPSVMQDIIDLLNAPEAPVAEVLHLITIEIAHLVVAIRTCSERRAPIAQVKFNMSQIRALQLLSKTAIKKYARSELDDSHMDGPRFQVVYSEFVDCFRESLERATRRTPENDQMIQTTMKIFYDLFAGRKDDIRRKVGKVDSSNLKNQ